MSRQRKHPREYQERIVGRILAEFKSGDRTIVQMACGTGKTLVALWVAERLAPSTVVVFAPTLGLLAQLAREWLENSEKTPGCLAVCSNDALMNGFDEIRPAPAECPFKVASGVEDIRAYLDTPTEGMKLIFCTYQSADFLGLAMVPGEVFDLAIFDEAHRATGRLDSIFTFALSDQKMPIQKRLFMTATPRSYKTNRPGLKRSVYSMDKEREYGRVCAALDFSEAIEKGIICPCKIVISAMDSAQFSPESLGKYSSDDRGSDPRTASACEGLTKALRKYDIRKIITFHSTIEGAERFVRKGLSGYLPEYEKLHISSRQGSNERREILERFDGADRAVLSNARCLTEGIDVPSVDMVAFMDPKYSLIDIVQSIGRAMRISPGKKAGYVFIPLLLDRRGGELMGEALARTRYEMVWDVLNAIFTVNDRLQHEIDLYRQNIGYGNSPALLAPDVIDIINSPIGIDIGELRKSISVEIARQIGSVWDEHYGELLKYYETNGHIEIPTDHCLRGWLKAQRQRWSKGAINERQKRLLLELGFDFTPLVTAWSKTKSRLMKHYEKYGHCNVTRAEDFDLYIRLKELRRVYNRGKLLPEKIRTLEALNIQWAPQSIEWVERYFDETLTMLTNYRNERGHCDISTKANPAPMILQHRVPRLRKAFKRGELNDEQIAQCQAIGFELDPLGALRRRHYETLRELAAQNVDLNSLAKEHPEGKWLSVQRSRYARGNLPQQDIEALEALGVSWEPPQIMKKAWEKNYAEVEKYFKEHKTESLPSTHKCYNWLKQQWQLLDRGKLLPERSARLGLLSPNRKKRPGKWSQWEKRFVRDNPDLTVAQLAAKLPCRTVYGVQAMRCKMGLKRPERQDNDKQT